jgi:hypothetical protein
MKKGKTTKKKQLVVGKKRYFDETTGESKVFNVIEQHDTDFNFQKIWLAHLLEALDVIGNKKIKVMNYLLSIKNNENLIISNQRKIAEGAGVSLPVVNETMKILMDIDALRKHQNGVYMLNPEIIFKGYNSKRMDILLTFKNIEEVENQEEQQELPLDQDKNENE